MRPLTEDEMKSFFEKLTKFVGENVRLLLERPDGDWCFRLHNDRVYYMSLDQLKIASSVPRENIVCVGTCFGKFTKGGKFRLHITCLDHVAKFAKFKVWLKPSAEQSYLYGNHVLKAGLGRITEDTPQYQGVVVYNMGDVPLGFGVTAHSTAECRKLEPTGIAAFHQADIGEYLRGEQELC